MDYIFENAKNIMMLCFGGGFIILAFYISRTLYIIIKLLQKINSLTDLTIRYVNKPLNLLMSFEKTATKMLQKFIK